uniref:Collagen type IV alpha-3-binding protein n=1 Tax=Heterorhabditis bacteriophora TaxID=37862 RepID=A0A1I7XP45_HETBA
MGSDQVLPSCGVLKKWTNFVTGWQDRYFEIKNGKLLYYKSKVDQSAGCRGSISLKSVNITSHEFDECEFTVNIGADLVWYLKAENSHSKDLWMKAISRDFSDSDYSSTSTKSHSRNPSLSSAAYNEKLENNANLSLSRVAELESYRTIYKDQMISLRRQLEQSGIPQTSILSIYATNIAILDNIDHIIELVKTGKSTSPLISTDIQYASTLDSKEVLPISTSLCENINNTIPANCSKYDVTSECGDEWHDADDHSLCSIDNGEEATERCNSATYCGSETTLLLTSQSSDKLFEITRHLPFGNYDNIEILKDHRYFDEVEKLTMDQLKYALAGVQDNIWTLFAQDGAMRMYTREVTEGGLPVDPLKAVHTVQGVTALEFMHYFFDAKYKKEWDHTLDAMSVVEQISRDTVILHQKHKTVWPAAPRESLFVSHIRRVDILKNEGSHDLYIVCNKDIKRDDVPLGSSSSVRVGLTVSMICETVIHKDKPICELTRSDIQCNIIYVSQVHPGGWVPTAALRHVYKKEYPKFLRTFTDYVLKNVGNKQVVI